jgi:hypothetical protein
MQTNTPKVPSPTTPISSQQKGPSNESSPNHSKPSHPIPSAPKPSEEASPHSKQIPTDDHPHHLPHRICINAQLCLTLLLCIQANNPGPASLPSVFRSQHLVRVQRPCIREIRYLGCAMHVCTKCTLRKHGSVTRGPNMYIRLTGSGGYHTIYTC